MWTFIEELKPMWFVDSLIWGHEADRGIKDNPSLT